MSEQIVDVYAEPVQSSILSGVETVLSVMEQLETIYVDLQNLEEALPIKYQPDAVAIKERALAIIKALDDENDDVQQVYKTIQERSSLTASGNKSKIERLGLQEQVIRLRKAGKSYAYIAEKIGVSTTLVSRFCRIYDTLSPKEQIKTRHRSVMDFVGHWEEMGALIYRMLARLEGDPENHVRYIGELRQLLKNVEQFQTKYSAQQELQQIKSIIQEILCQELPNKRLEIMQRFREAGVNRMLPTA
jgi:hypothetical protein